jgi:hypothetical protein
MLFVCICYYYILIIMIMAIIRNNSLEQSP